MNPPQHKCYQTWRDYALAQPELWIFGYGSLMWKPDFPFAARHKSTAEGVSRRYCIISIAYRGTPESPGRVLGLVEGGQCHGIAYHVENPDIALAFDNVWKREMISDAYSPRMISIQLEAAPTRKITALSFLADPKHEQFDGESSDATLAHYIQHAQGKAGSNLDYFRDTLQHLHNEGVQDNYLQRLSRKLT